MNLILSLLLFLGPVSADSVDILIRHGTVYDGSGGPARQADIGIRGDRIVFVGDAAQAKLASKQTIDATGLIVSPGFIDPHTHSFEGLPNLNEERRKNAGATTTANRSSSPASHPAGSISPTLGTPATASIIKAVTAR